MNSFQKLASPTGWEPHNAVSRPQGYAAQPKDFDWLEKNIPCQAACPAGTDIPEYLAAIAQGDYEQAYRINLEDNVFPAVLGRVCTRPCEPACRHGWEGLGEPVAICFSKRSAADFINRSEPIVLEKLFEHTGKHIAVVGGGAAGLATARELARMGHEVTVYEKHSRAGGMMVQGIPHFRLPRDLIAREIEQVERMGVKIMCNAGIGDDTKLSELIEQNDAVVIAVGNFKPNVPSMPGIELEGVVHGLPFLQGVNESGSGSVGKQVVVIGGGFTAVDCARTAQRLDAEHVGMYYRRSAEEMYITPGEVDEMLHEGIEFQTMVAPVAFVGEGGKLKAVQFVKTELGEPDEEGRRRPVPIKGSEFEVPADTVLLGTGQKREGSWVEEALRRELLDEHDAPKTGADVKAAMEKVYMAGDFAIGATSLIDAIGHAKKCARQIDTDLMGEARLRDLVLIEDRDEPTTGRTREMDDIPRQPMPTASTDGRSLTKEVETGFQEDGSQTEASRCYLCHYKFEIDNELCIYCDRCLKVKPVEDCIVKVSAMTYEADGRITGYKRSSSSQDYNLLYIDQNECIRCGACADVCPVDCITLQKVSQRTVSSWEL